MSDFQGIDLLFRRVREMRQNVQDADKALRAASVYVLGSVEKTFRAQGRPKAWTALAPATLAKRRKGRGRGGPQILIDRARLKNSISYRLTGAGAEIGTNVIYAKRQHFGYEGGKGRGRSKTPARPFLVIQPEDVTEIGNIFRRRLRS